MIRFPEPFKLPITIVITITITAIVSSIVFPFLSIGLSVFRSFDPGCFFFSLSLYRPANRLLPFRSVLCPTQHVIFPIPPPPPTPHENRHPPRFRSNDDNEGPGFAPYDEPFAFLSGIRPLPHRGVFSRSPFSASEMAYRLTAAMLLRLLSMIGWVTATLAHADQDQKPIAGPHKSLWYNALPGDGGTQVWGSPTTTGNAYLTESL